MQGKVCVVTGANRGIGRATAEALARQGATVLLVCRDRAAGEMAKQEIARATGNAKLELYVADFAVQGEVHRVAAEIRSAHSRLDVLVSNAGVLLLNRVTTVDNIEATFAVNHLASFILINELSDLLKASAPSRVVIVASEAHHRVSDPEDWASTKAYNGRTAYNRSKLANVVFSYDLAHRLEGTGVTVNCCHPGWVNTHILFSMYDRWWLRWLWPIVQKRFTVTPEAGAKIVVDLATSHDFDGVTGKYFKAGRATTSSLISHDPVIGARLWNLSLRFTGELPPVTITGEHIATP